MSLMGLLIGGAIGSALMGGASSLIGSFMNRNAVKENNAANLAIANELNNTKINLANTAHQREIQDLQAAGLNPILSAGSGGSFVPTLSTPQQQPASMDLNGLANVFNSLSHTLLTGALINGDIMPLNKATIAEKEAHANYANERAMTEWKRAWKLEKQGDLYFEKSRIANANFSRMRHTR